MDRFEQVRTGETVSRMLSKFCLPFDKATPLVRFPKALKRLQNNAGPASIYSVVANFVTLARHDSKSGGTQSLLAEWFSSYHL